MKKEVEYHEVEVRFIVQAREAKRATGDVSKTVVRSKLATLIYNAIGGNDTNSIDFEDMKIVIDGRPELG